ncbi:hypothetical protein [Prauserella rugosa]|uniref:Uncharacterized protein n=1 Tax=Prauserella rugosa TaxID=43354 RepID=A0A660CDZ6_9PSEU|nr:hypothetical protein [Prauserella rugosa]TWH21556.1 hypothetical protein JD82_03421 [Prauserella rugosa]
MHTPDQHGEPDQTAIEEYRRIFDGYPVEVTRIADLLEEPTESAETPDDKP